MSNKIPQETISKTILSTYWHAMVISENCLWLKKSGALNDIVEKDDNIKEAIKQLGPAANRYINIINKQFKGARVGKMTLEQQQEVIFKIMEATEEMMKGIMV